MLSVLRLGHRRIRDARISTHCGLVARAFSADEIIYSGERDKALIERINDITKRWGGPFKARYEEKWRDVIKRYKEKGFVILHLTMYGLPLKNVMSRIRKQKRRNLLVIIGGEKVPAEVYALSDYNIAITNQPHSEVAAIAVFLHELLKGKGKRFRNAKIRIIPQEKGKKVFGKMIVNASAKQP